MTVEQTKELLQKCIDAEMSLNELRDYLSTNLDQEPDEWLKEKGARQSKKEKQVEDYAKDKFKTRDPGQPAW